MLKAVPDRDANDMIYQFDASRDYNPEPDLREDHGEDPVDQQRRRSGQRGGRRERSRAWRQSSKPGQFMLVPTGPRDRRPWDGDGAGAMGRSRRGTDARITLHRRLRPVRPPLSENHRHEACTPASNEPGMVDLATIIERRRALSLIATGAAGLASAPLRAQSLVDLKPAGRRGQTAGDGGFPRQARDDPATDPRAAARNPDGGVRRQRLHPERSFSSSAGIMPIFPPRSMSPRSG